MDVWQRLGIEKTDDERAIKRAYAKQLKSIRPDEDAKQFQSLREARDEAIYLAKYDFDYEFDWEEEETRDEPSSSSNNDGELGSLADQGVVNEELERALAEAESSFEEPYVVTLEEPGSVPLERDRNIDSKVENKHDRTEATADAFSKEGTLFDQSLSTSRGEGAVDNGSANGTLDSAVTDAVDGRVDDSQALRAEEDELANFPGFYDVDIDDLTYEHIDDEIENLMGPWSLWDAGEWKKFIHRVREASFDMSNYAEYEILNAFGENLIEVKIETEVKQTSRLAILKYLNEEYGWTQNDRRVYAILPDDQSEILMDSLRRGQDGVSKGGGETYYDAFGFPLLTAEHFKDYLGTNDSVYEKYYQKSLNEGRVLKASWCWPGFLFSPFWLAHRCNDGLEALAGMFYIMALIVLHYGATTPSLLAYGLGCFMLVSIHLVIGVYGKKLVVTTLASSLQDLEEDKKLDSAEKLKKLASIGRGGFKAMFEFAFGMWGIGLIALIVYRFLL